MNKITPEHIENLIVVEQYHVFPGTCTTVCCLTLRNGFTTVGSADCVDPADFDKQTGRDIARRKAVDKIWMLEGYMLNDRLRAKEPAL